MKISELINYLVNNLAAHGNLDVGVMAGQIKYPVLSVPMISVDTVKNKKTVVI